MWIAAIALSALVALVFVANGAAKMLGHLKMIEASTHLGYSMRSFRIIGLLECLKHSGSCWRRCVFLSVSPPRLASSSSRSGDLSPTYVRRIPFVWPRPRSGAHY